MGGYGSGRWTWHSKRQTVEDALTLSLRPFKETFSRGQVWRGSVVWTNTATGKQTNSIGYEFYPVGVDRESVQAGQLRLYYTTTRPSGEKVESDYRLDLETTPCNFGGVRWWFVCPLVKDGRPCRRRCGKLHKPFGALYFGCRACYDLTYTSCQESHKFDAMFAALAEGSSYTAADMKRALTRLGRF